MQGIIVIWPDDAYIDFDESHDVIKLIKLAKDLEKKVIIDLDPSGSTVWFEDSENNVNSLSDFYIWRPAINLGSDPPIEPNNWVSVRNT